MSAQANFKRNGDNKPLELVYLMRFDASAAQKAINALIILLNESQCGDNLTPY